MIKKIFILLIILYSSLFAHPHTFIEVYPTVKVQNNKTINFHLKWIIDEMTSSMLIMEFDQNGDGKINDDENQFAYDNYFKSLRDYNFYTNIKIKGKSQFFPKVKFFKTTIQNNKICYDFDLDKSYNIKDTVFDFGDEDFFVAMVLKKEFVKIDGAKAIVSDLDMDFYFGYRFEFEENK